MLVSIILFFFIRTDVLWLRVLSRIILVPAIAGISYEFIRYAGKHDNWLVNIISALVLLCRLLQQASQMTL